MENQSALTDEQALVCEKLAIESYNIIEKYIKKNSPSHDPVRILMFSRIIGIICLRLVDENIKQESQKVVLESIFDNILFNLDKMNFTKGL